MPLRILQLGPYPPPEGGITRNMLAIRDELVARGHSCSIIATSQSSSVGSEENVYHPRSAVGLMWLLWRLGYDVLHLHLGGDISKRVLRLAAACSFFGFKKSVLTLHSGEFPLTDEARNASPDSNFARIFRKFSKVIAVNRAIADVFINCGVAPSRIEVIAPYSLALPDENVTVPSEIADFCKKHSPLLVSVGGLERDYDPLFQIVAMKDILATFRHAGLLMIGGGSMHDEVIAVASATRYAEHIRVAGSIDHGTALYLIRYADIMLRTTLFDGDAISVREALFLGTPVMATDVGHRPEGVHLIKVGEKGQLVEKIGEIISTPRSSWAASAPDDANIKKVVDLYEELARAN